MYEIVNGNHRLDTFQELKLETVFAYDLGEIPLKLAKKIAIQLNETRFPTDHISLAEMVAEIAGSFSTEELSAFPFSLQEIEDMKGLLAFDWDQDGTGAVLDDKDYALIVKTKSQRRMNDFLKAACIGVRAEKMKRRLEIDLDKEG